MPSLSRASNDIALRFVKTTTFRRDFLPALREDAIDILDTWMDANGYEGVEIDLEIIYEDIRLANSGGQVTSLPNVARQTIQFEETSVVRRVKNVVRLMDGTVEGEIQHDGDTITVFKDGRSWVPAANL